MSCGKICTRRKTHNIKCFAIKQDERKIKALRFQLKRVESKKPRAKGQETKQTVGFIHGERGIDKGGGGVDNSGVASKRPSKIKSNFKRREKHINAIRIEERAFPQKQRSF